MREHASHPEIPDNVQMELPRRGSVFKAHSGTLRAAWRKVPAKSQEGFCNSSMLVSGAESQEAIQQGVQRLLLVAFLFEQRGLHYSFVRLQSLLKQGWRLADPCRPLRKVLPQQRLHSWRPGVSRWARASRPGSSLKNITMGELHGNDQ